MSPDFRDILSAFLDEGVEFLLLGAQALSGFGRLTYAPATVRFSNRTASGPR